MMKPVRLDRPALASFAFCVAFSACDGVTDLEAPGTRLIGIDALEYAGAFRVPAQTFGASDLNFSEGPIEVTGSSLFIVGHTYQQAIAEFAIPPLVISETLTDLNMAGVPRQDFVTVLDRAGANPQALDRISAMRWVDGPAGPELIVNAYEYYDAPGDNSHTTLVVRDPEDLAGSPVDGFYAMEGAAHAGGWMTDVPAGWRDLLGGPMIAGHSSGVPIIGRLSVGPSAFVFDPMAIVGTSSPPDPVPTEPLLDYDLGRPLHADLSNASGFNAIWTHLSRAVYGFIVPGTRSYLVLGHSGGHGPDGICYKCTPTGETSSCGGYCAVDPDDYALHYWIFDVDDFVRVRNGELAPHEVQPYESGPFAAPFSAGELGGGSYDADTGLLYVSMQRADRDQGTYANPPVIVAFRVVS